MSALAVAGATSAQVAAEANASGSAGVRLLAGKPEFVTFCHVAGRGEDPANRVTLTLPYNAVFGQGGHFNEDGTPQAGHEQDSLGECREEPPPPPIDVCPNLEGDQAEVPDGMVKDAHGNCVHEEHPPAPIDVCPNLEGDQAQVPDGMVKDAHGNCVHEEHPPPPPPPHEVSDEFMDVQVVKDATAHVQLVNGQADIAYSVRVRNNGPNQAHNVQLVDAAPAGVTFLAVTLQPAEGTCSITPALLSCSLATLGPGVERTIGFSARVTQAGTYVNWATGAGDGKDTNGANNTDDASTLVTAPVTPPVTTPKPQPTVKPASKPAPDVCHVLKVTPGMVTTVGKRQLLLAKVTQSKNPIAGVAVRFAGSGFAKVVRTNARGVARVEITPSKAGIVLVRISGAKACNTARIGVIGAFEPPVTG